MPSQWEMAFEYGQEWRELNRRLRHAGEKGLTRELRKAVREAAKPGRDAAKLAARAIPAKGPRSRGLRRRMARGVGIQATGTRVRIVTRMPAGMEMLPRGFDTEKGWRKPLFGDRERWFQQPGHPWFRSTIAKTAPKAREEMKAAMDRVAAQITE
ncbi:hypothetical protein ACQEVF_32445 [Nonomuraea polychroma]|uniref:hypothetical protein n=1 Tax=Nonomuraea polychroma TaxID=46176 RepID=UPI003D8D9A00